MGRPWVSYRRCRGQGSDPVHPSSARGTPERTPTLGGASPARPDVLAIGIGHMQQRLAAGGKRRARLELPPPGSTDRRSRSVFVLRLGRPRHGALLLSPRGVRGGPRSRLSLHPNRSGVSSLGVPFPSGLRVPSAISQGWVIARNPPRSTQVRSTQDAECTPLLSNDASFASKGMRARSVARTTSSSRGPCKASIFGVGRQCLSGEGSQDKRVGLNWPGGDIFLDLLFEGYGNLRLCHHRVNWNRSRRVACKSGVRFAARPSQHGLTEC